MEDDEVERLRLLLAHAYDYLAPGTLTKVIHRLTHKKIVQPKGPKPPKDKEVA